ncbi:MAG: hypothetical protein ACE3JK_14370 [Sporolactobacillus sp.]
MKEKIEEALNKLIGLKFQYAGRASNLLWLGFGPMISVTRRGKTEQLAEYALHIQCAWRIMKENRMVAASADFYYPRSDWKGMDDHFEWDIQGNNRFDEKINCLTTYQRN